MPFEALAYEQDEILNGVAAVGDTSEKTSAVEVSIDLKV